MKNYILGLVLLTLGSCTNNNTQKTGDTSADSAAIARKVPDVGVELSNPVEQKIYDDYIQLKNALIAKKSGQAAKAATQLSSSLKARQGCENTALIADKIAASAEIKSQRKDFVSLSADVIALFKHAALKSGEIYVQHCPMANEGNGADWLASENKIRNPYYGEEMMECGAVVDQIKPIK